MAKAGIATIFGFINKTKERKYQEIFWVVARKMVSQLYLVE